jgi:hypothetical protein
MATVAIVAATVLSYAIGWAVKSPPLVPVFNMLASYPFMLAALRRGDVRLAITRMLIWALTMGVCATLLAYARPWEAGKVFANGANYREQMFAWVMTGQGAESSPSQFIPMQLRDTAVFTIVTLVSAGFGSMAMGAALMNYMGTYVGSLAAASAHPIAAAIFGWHPWAVIRVVSFVVIGVVLSLPLLSWALGFSEDVNERRRLLTWAAAGIATDMILKALLAPAWRHLLIRITGW